MNIPIQHNGSSCTISFLSPINPESIYALCNSIDLATGYYKHSEINLNIHSLGGELDSHRHFVAQLPRWRRLATIITMAMSDCASAAAMMLALGDLGRRHASIQTRILFHRPRVDAGPVLSRQAKATAGVLTARSGKTVIRELSRLERAIEREDDHHFGVVRKHIKPIDSDRGWFHTERRRRGELLLNDLDQLISSANEGAVFIDTPDAERLATLALSLTDASLDDKESFAAVEEIFNEIVDEDRNCHPLLVWATFRLDHVQGLDLGTPSMEVLP